MKYYKFSSPEIEDFFLFKVKEDNDYKVITLDINGVYEQEFKFKPYKDISNEFLNDGYSVEEISADDFMMNLEYLKYKACVLNSGVIEEESHG